MPVSDLDTPSVFGFSGISLTEDGNTLVVADKYKAVDSLSTVVTGEVHVYTRETDWQLNQTITPPLTANDQQFGSDVQITPDGMTLAIGAHQTGDIITNNGMDCTFSTNGSGNVVSVTIVGGNSESGYPASGTFTITAASDTNFVGTPAVISYSSVQSIINSVQVVSGGSGYTPSLVNHPISVDDMPVPTASQVFWPDVAGSSTNSMATRLGLGRVHRYEKRGASFSPAQSNSTLTWLTEGAPAVGLTVDTSADGTVVAVAGVVEPYLLEERITTGNIHVGMTAVFELAPPETLSNLTRYHSSVIDLSFVDTSYDNLIPPTPVASHTSTGIIHRLSADGTTIVIGHAVPGMGIHVLKTTDGGETWQLDASLGTIQPIVHDVSVSDDGNRVVLYGSNGLEKQARATCIQTWNKSLGTWNSAATITYPWNTPMLHGTFDDLATPHISGDGSLLFIRWEGYRVPITFDTLTDVDGDADKILQGYFNTGDVAQYKKPTGATGDIGLVDGNLYYIRQGGGGQLFFYPTLIDAQNQTNIIDIYPTASSETHHLIPIVASEQRVDVYQWVNDIDGGHWSFVNPDTPMSLTSSTYGFGSSLSSTSNGELLVVASAVKAEPTTADDPASGVFARTVTLYTRTEMEGPSTWIRKLLLQSGPYTIQYEETPEFSAGVLVSMSGSGNTILCVDGILNHVYIAEKDLYTTGAYVWKQLLLSDTPLVDTGFGGEWGGPIRGAALSKDGNTIVVGAWKVEVDATSNAGGLYVFRKGAKGPWYKEQFIPSPCPVTDGQFGITVAINEDGTLITAASPSPSGHGQVHVFSTTAPASAPSCPTYDDFDPEVLTTTYVQRSVVNATTPTEYQLVGRAVASDTSGNRIVIGGAQTRVMLRTGDVWEVEQELIPPALSDIQSRVEAEYGAAVAINSTGDVVVVTAPAKEVSATPTVGEIFVFQRSGTTWTLEKTISSPAVEETTYFGKSVAINTTGNVIVVGTNSFSSATGVGQIYVYRNTTGGVSGTWNNVRVNPPSVTLAYSLAVAYVDNGTNKGIVAFSGADDVDYIPRTFICSHTYGSPDTVTVSYTYEASVNGNSAPGIQQGALKFSPDKGQYLVLGDPYFSQETGRTTGQVIVLKNTGTIGSDRNPAGPWNEVAHIVPGDLASNLIYSDLPRDALSYVVFGAAVDVTAGASQILITAPEFSPPDVLDANVARVFGGGSAWVYQKGVGDQWSASPDHRVFQPGPDYQTIGGSAVGSSDMQVVVLGGSNTYHEPLTPTDPALYGIGAAQIFTLEPIPTNTNFAYSNFGLEDSELSGGTGYGKGSHALSRDGQTLVTCYGQSTTGMIDIYVNTVLNQRVDVGINVDRIRISDNGNMIVASNHLTGQFVTLLRSGSPASWSVVDVFTGSDTVYGYEFQLSGDASTLFVSSSTGTVQYITVYSWNGGTNNWDVEDNTTISGAAVLDGVELVSARDFGKNMSSSSNGDWLTVTGVRWTTIRGSWTYNSPCVYVYKRTLGTWALFSVVVAFQSSQEAFSTNQQVVTKMTADGTAFVVGHRALNRVWVFERDASTTNTFNCVAKLTYEDSAVTGGEDGFGAPWTVDISDDASLVIAGGQNWNGNKGRAVMWRRIENLWRTEVVFYNPINATSGVTFGSSVACDATGSTITISDGYTTNDSPTGGTLWVFQLLN